MHAQVFALGVYSVFEQILEAIPTEERTEIFNAYIRSLDEDPETYRRDAAALEAAASVLTASETLGPDAQGLEVQKTLARVSEKVATGKFGYSKFFAIGLFRYAERRGLFAATPAVVAFHYRSNLSCHSSLTKSHPYGCML